MSGFETKIFKLKQESKEIFDGEEERIMVRTEMAVAYADAANNLQVRLEIKHQDGSGPC